MYKIVRYFPLIIIGYTVLWPFTYPSAAVSTLVLTRFEQLPVFNIAGFNIRVLEVVFFLLFFFFYLSLLTRSSMRSIDISKKRIISRSLLVASFLTIWILLGLINGSSRIAGDLRVLSYGLFVLMLIPVITTEQELFQVFRGIFIALILLVIINIATSFFQTYAKIGKISRLSITMAIFLFCISISYYIHYRKKTTRYFIAGALASLPAVMTLSKWGITALAAAFLISPLLAYRNYKKKVISFYFISMYIGLFTVALFYLLPVSDTLAKSAGYDSFEQYVQIRILHSERTGEADISGDRINRWLYSMEIVKESPIFGKGLGFTSSYEHKMFGTESTLMEHNIIIWLLLRTGLVGTILIMYVVFRFAKFSLRVYRREEDLKKRALLNAVITYIAIFALLNLLALRISNFEEAIIFWFSVFTVYLLDRLQKKGGEVEAAYPM